MSKFFLTNFSLSTLPTPPVPPTPLYLEQRNGDAQMEEVRGALGLKTTEEKISEIIAQSLSFDPSSDPFAKKMFIEIRLEDAKKEASAPEPDHENIVEILNQVIALDPETPWAHFDRGQSLINLRRYEDAALDFTQELELHGDGPGVFRSYFERAWCNIEMNEIRLAVQDFGNYKKSDIGNGIDAKFVTTLQLRIDGAVDKLYENAQIKFSEANNLKFSDFGEEKKEIYLETETEKYLSSLELFNQLVECSPEKPWARYLRGLNLVSLGRYEEAVFDFEKELEINQSEHCKKVCTYEKAIAHGFLKDYEKSKSGFEYLLQIQGESQDPIFEVAKSRLEQVEIEEKLDRYAPYMPYALPALAIYFLLATCLATQYIGNNARNRGDNARNRGEDSDRFRDEKEATDYIKNFARGVVDNSSYEELANYLVENFHKLPKDFFQKIIKSSSAEELGVFLDGQQLLSAEVKKGLVENFGALKEYEKDRLPQPSHFKFPKNYLRDYLLKNSDSKNYPNDPVRMAEAIRNFEDEASRHFQEICENLLRHEKIKPLLADLVSNVEDLLIVPAKDSNAVRPEEILESPEKEIPSESPLKAAGKKIDPKPYHFLPK